MTNRNRVTRRQAQSFLAPMRRVSRLDRNVTHGG